MESQLATGALAITKVLEVRLEIEGPQAEQLKTAPVGRHSKIKVMTGVRKSCVLLE